MKEFYSTTGGRHLYNSDINNLQQLALSCSEIFRECGGNFVISGCSVANGYVEAGFVWLNGKIREVERTPIESTSNLCITALDTQGDSILYGDGNSYRQNTNYGTAVSNLTVGSGIVFNTTNDRFPNLEDVFFNTYALVKNAASQTVSAQVVFDEQVDFRKTNYKKNTFNTASYVDDSGNFQTVLSATGSDTITTFVFSKDGKLTARVNGAVLWQLDGVSGKLVVNSLKVTNGEITTLTAGTVTISNKITSSEIETNSLKVNGNIQGGETTLTKLSAQNVSASTGTFNNLKDCTIFNLVFNTTIINGGTIHKDSCIVICDTPNSSVRLPLESELSVGKTIIIKNFSSTSITVSGSGSSNSIIADNSYSDSGSSVTIKPGETNIFVLVSPSLKTWVRLKFNQ